MAKLGTRIFQERRSSTTEMTDWGRVERRRQFCPRCGQLMFEYYRSPDGHYGLAGDVRRDGVPGTAVIRCPTCGARFVLLERLSSEGQPIRRL